VKFKSPKNFAVIFSNKQQIFLLFWLFFQKLSLLILMKILAWLNKLHPTTVWRKKTTFFCNKKSLGPPRQKIRVTGGPS
jgi:hypothetical protein